MSRCLRRREGTHPRDALDEERESVAFPGDQAVVGIREGALPRHREERDTRLCRVCAGKPVPGAAVRGDARGVVRPMRSSVR